MISVIIPTYNRGKMVVRAIKSVLDQTYQDIECIVVDDASTDDTECQISEIRDSRLHYLKLPQNRGACFARNAGVEASKGEYIAFQDSDDIWLPCKLEKQLAFLDATQSDIVFCQMLSSNLITGKKYYFPNCFFSNKKVNGAQILSGNFASTQTLLGKRACFLQCPFDIHLHRMQDWDLMIALIQRYHVSYLREVLVHSFVGQDSITSNPEKGIVSCQYLLKKWKNYYTGHARALSSVYTLMVKFQIQKGENPNSTLWKALKYYPLNIKLWKTLCSSMIVKAIRRR